MRRVKIFLLACGIFLLAFSSSTAGLAARPLHAPAAQTAGTTYVVRAGDNLSSIAWRAYGNAGAWVCIWNANNWIVNPNHLLPGWSITLPASGACGGGAPPPASTTYVVVAGDNLSTISQRHYGNAYSWACIWAANPWIVNPNYLLPSWKITIPASCASGGPAPAPAPRYHTVAHGETLSGIACYYYSDCNYWRIYNANRNLIAYPGYVQAGWRLVIP